MKKILYSLLAGLLLLGPMSCKKDEPAAPALASAPEATAADDNKSGGVYKGAIIGSSGTIKIVLQGGKKEVIIKIDGVTRTLTTDDLADWESGEEILDAEFSSGDWSIMLSLGADGVGGGISFSIAGHPNIAVALLKEKSDAMVMAYEGTYAGPSTGTFNFIVQGQAVFGVSRDSGGDTATFTGEKAGNSISVSIYGTNTVAVGTINGNSVSGTWAESVDVNGTWTGTRTL